MFSNELFKATKASCRYVNQVIYQLQRENVSINTLNLSLKEPDQYLDFIELLAILDRIDKYLDDEYLFIKSGSSITSSDYGILGFVAANSKNLLQAMELTYRHQQLISDAILSTVLIEGNVLINRLGNNTAEPEFIRNYIELDLASIISFCRVLTGNIYNDKKITVHFRHSCKGNVEVYRSLLNANVFFDQEFNQIIAPLDVLDLPICNADSEMLNYLKQKIDSSLKALGSSKTKIDKVKFFLLGSLPYHHPDLDTCAAYLGISKSTLKRQLKEEGSTYQNISDNVRFMAAKKLLDDRQYDVLTVALMLGYSDRSSFDKAFKRWIGYSPSEYKR